MVATLFHFRSSYTGIAINDRKAIPGLLQTSETYKASPLVDKVTTYLDKEPVPRWSAANGPPFLVNVPMLPLWASPFPYISDQRISAPETNKKAEKL